MSPRSKLSSPEPGCQRVSRNCSPVAWILLCPSQVLLQCSCDETHLYRLPAGTVGGCSVCTVDDDGGGHAVHSGRQAHSIDEP
jgi:hypothetical protein